MNSYAVKLMPNAAQDLDRIYSYISSELLAPNAAEHLAQLLEDSILNLKQMPYRGAVRKTGVYTDKEYRQLFVKNFTIIYRIDQLKNTILIVTVRYTPSHF